MVEFLQSSVGIIHKNYAESITTSIKESVDKDLNDNNSNSDSLLNSKKRLTFCVEGNISDRKSTFLQRTANETIELQDIVEIVPEPVGKWQDIGPDHFNILNAFYAEPHRYAYTFQNYVFVQSNAGEGVSGGTKPLGLMERSVFSDRMQAPTRHKRMLLRKRAEEGGVSLDYLRDLHESWLFPFESGNHGVLSVSKLPDLRDRTFYPDIRDRAFYLEGSCSGSGLQPNIDFNIDIEAKREYARQIADFEFVKKKKETDDKASDDAKRNRRPQMLLPYKGGLQAESISQNRL